MRWQLINNLHLTNHMKQQNGLQLGVDQQRMQKNILRGSWINFRLRATSQSQQHWKKNNLLPKIQCKQNLQKRNPQNLLTFRCSSLRFVGNNRVVVFDEQLIKKVESQFRINSLPKHIHANKTQEKNKTKNKGRIVDNMKIRMGNKLKLNSGERKNEIKLVADRQGWEENQQKSKFFEDIYFSQRN